MNRHSVSDQKLKHQIYKICFEELTLRNKLFNQRARRFEVVFVLSCSLLMAQLLLYILLFLYGITHLVTFTGSSYYA